MGELQNRGMRRLPSEVSRDAVPDLGSDLRKLGQTIFEVTPVLFAG
jgi:hypothetical protein